MPLLAFLAGLPEWAQILGVMLSGFAAWEAVFETDTGIKTLTEILTLASYVLPSWSLPTIQANGACTQYLQWICYIVPIDYAFTLELAFIQFVIVWFIYIRFIHWTSLITH